MALAISMALKRDLISSGSIYIKWVLAQTEINFLGIKNLK